MVMERTAGDTGALGEAIVFLDYFKDLPDPRQRGKVLYPLDEVLLVRLLAVLAGSEAITDIARFGEKKLELLRRFRPFRDGTPSHDYLGDILATLDSEQFQRCFVAWVAALTGMPSDVIAIDGKTSRRGTLREDVELFATEQKANGFKDTKVSRHETVDGDHGRIETRTYTAFHDVAWLQERHDWPGLQGVIMVESTREIGNKLERETRFYITSLAWLAAQLGPVVRAHWAIENSLHWVMDMIFRDDECRVRTDHAPANFTTIKHMALNLIRRAPGKDSFRLKRKIAAWDDDFLASLIAA
jgi:predicted transposase YbfD/YdcC